MRYIFMVLVVLLLAASTALSNGNIVNGKDLVSFLMTGHCPTKNIESASDRGCSPKYCSNDIDGLSFLYENKMIQRADGKRIRLNHHATGKPDDLPEIDWPWGSGYKVFRADKRWGTCIEFGHTGIGKSGRYQRWTSVVLIPWEGSQPGLIAHRFVGYWAYCASLAEGEKEGEVMLPIIEPINIGYGPLQLVWYHCNTERCTKIKDKRIVSGDSNSESGELVIKEMPKTTRNK